MKKEQVKNIIYTQPKLARYDFNYDKIAAKPKPKFI